MGAAGDDPFRANDLGFEALHHHGQFREPLRGTMAAVIAVIPASHTPANTTRTVRWRGFLAKVSSAVRPSIVLAWFAAERCAWGPLWVLAYGARQRPALFQQIVRRRASCCCAIA